MLEWSDLNTILAVSRAGTATAAAEQLGVHPSTVFRRLNAMERALGVQFFKRLPDGYVATSAGEEACAVAERMETEVAVLGRRLSGRDLRPSGTVRVTTTDTLVGLINRDLAQFSAEYPEINLRLLVTNRFFDMTRHDADIAVRPAPNPPEGLVGTRLARIATALYASKDYLSGRPTDTSLADHHWVGPDESLGGMAIARWMKAEVPSAQVRLRANSLMATLEAVKAGMGVSPLPAWLGDAESGLHRVRGPIPEMNSELWVLTHPDLRYVARIKAVMDYLKRSLVTRRALIEGDGVGATITG